MSISEPFMPHPDHDETIAAADPGQGAPDTAPGFGVGGEDPDTGEGSEAPDAADQADTPFRTPDGTSVDPARHDREAD
jgi:hypothetical protein